MFAKSVLNKAALLAVAGLLATGGMARAAAMINLSIQGSTDNGQTWSNALSVDPGTAIKIQVVGTMAPVGTTNKQGSAAAKTITSLTQTATSSSDGIGALTFNVVDSSTGTFSSQALAGSWSAGTGASAGTVSGQTLTGIHPILANGAANQVGPTVLATANFTVGQFNVSEILSGIGSGSGSFKINGGSAVFPTATTESGTDPYVSYSPLTLTAVPEPATMALIGLAVPAVLRRRRLGR